MAVLEYSKFKWILMVGVWLNTRRVYNMYISKSKGQIISFFF